MAGQWHCHSVGASMLVSEEEEPDNHHEVEGVEGRRKGKHYKGWKQGGGCHGGGMHNVINNIFF